MGYYVSHMIGIRTGGVFSGKTDMTILKEQINKIIKELRGTENDTGLKDDALSHCMSNELESNKGSYVVIAGVFNYWMIDRATIFCKKLSITLGVEIMHMAWDEVNNEIQCHIYLNGESLFDIDENPLGRIFRRLL